jgi:hypothetical protein
MGLTLALILPLLPQQTGQRRCRSSFGPARGKTIGKQFD